MGEMQALMMAKIEELTLHQIAHEKQIQENRAHVDALERKNIDLREQLSAILSRQ